RVPSLHGHYPASSLLRTRPPPSRLRPLSRDHRLYDLPFSVDFSPGRGGLLQLLSASLSPCRRHHPAGAHRRISQIATTRPASTPRIVGSTSGAIAFSGPPLRSLSLRPGNSLTTLKMASSMGFRSSVSLLPAIQATRLLAFASAGLSPAERASLGWTHIRTC